MITAIVIILFILKGIAELIPDDPKGESPEIEGDGIKEEILTGKDRKDALELFKIK